MLEYEFYISRLLNTHLKGELNAEQLAELNAWAESNPAYADVLKNFGESEQLKLEIAHFQSADKASVWNKTMAGLNQEEAVVKERGFKLWPRLAAAASILLILSVGLYFYAGLGKKQLAIANDINPGKNVATLMLSNGKRIQLSDQKTGVVIGDAGVKYNDGSSVGEVAPESADASVSFFTASTPRGGQYQVVLPDGTKVWLNSASSLKFPSVFSKSGNRRVELEGEGYFQVAKDKAHPFVVVTATQEVQVLGTHFNVNSYADEPDVKTTLLEGSVRVSGRFGARTIVPGQQVVGGVQGMKVVQADLDAAVAWQRNKFVFKDESLGSIMRQVARWYDVEVVYEGVSEELPFWGSVSRFEQLSKVLETLELTGSVRFKVQGKRVIVMK